MAQIVHNPSLIKAALIKGLRVGFVFVHEETTAEYHFVRDPRDEPNSLNSVVCVMYTSTISDPLRISGVSQPTNEFMKMVERSTAYGAAMARYTRTNTLLYPSDWYPCFETDKDARIAQVQKMIPELERFSLKVSEDDAKRIKEEKERQEVERKRRDEEIRKMEEARRARMTRIPNAPPVGSGSGGAPRPRADLTDSDLSELLAKGFFSSF